MSFIEALYQFKLLNELKSRKINVITIEPTATQSPRLCNFLPKNISTINDTRGKNRISRGKVIIGFSIIFLTRLHHRH